MNAPPDSPSAKSKAQVELYTDGNCLGNPGPGGWAFILRHPASERTKERSGGEPHTTNNRMEMTAVIRGLEALKFPTVVTLYSDSQYVVKGIMERMATHAACRWHKSARSPHLIKNADLWQRLHELAQVHPLTARWVQGHAGHPENERCDQLATAESERMSQRNRDGSPRTLEQMADDLLAEADD